MSLRRTSGVEEPGFTVRAVVNLWNFLLLIVADNMLPCVTAFAVDSAPIIVLEGADTFDGVWLVFVSLKRGSRGRGSGRSGRGSDSSRAVSGRRNRFVGGDRRDDRRRMRGCD